MINLATALQRSATCSPDKTAIICGDVELSYQKFNDISSKIASALIEQGVEKGDKVALSCFNIPYFPLVYFGILKAGACVVPLNVLLKSREIAYHLKDADAKFYFCFEGTSQLPMATEAIEAFKQVDSCKQLCILTADQTALEHQGFPTLSALIATAEPIAQAANTQSDDTAVILYTSGTTGLPKGAELTHSNMLTNALVSNDLMSATFDDVHIITLPLFHSFGQTVHMNAAVVSGATMVLVPQFTPDGVLSLIDKYKVTLFAGVPTMYIALLATQTEADISSLRLAISGGASLNHQVIKEFEQRFNVAILEGYGLSETSPVASFNYQHSRRPGSVGLPILGVEIQVVDLEGRPVAQGEKGEITIRGHNVMKGYLNRPEETEAAIRNGWFHTGDIGYFDEAGHLYIADRLKEMIIRGGFNVYPREIEETFMTHPDVAMVAVVGIPDEHYGEEIKAFVVLKPDAQIDSRQLQQWGQEQCAAHKYPRYVQVIDKLPMSATGKILKRELKSEHESNAD
ncbi:long-chain-fatty-acid--CoA ligase [Vibrio paucivorans]